MVDPGARNAGALAGGSPRAARSNGGGWRPPNGRPTGSLRNNLQRSGGFSRPLLKRLELVGNHRCGSPMRSPSKFEITGESLATRTCRLKVQPSALAGPGEGARRGLSCSQEFVHKDGTSERKNPGARKHAAEPNDRSARPLGQRRSPRRRNLGCANEPALPASHRSPVRHSSPRPLPGEDTAPASPWNRRPETYMEGPTRPLRCPGCETVRDGGGPMSAAQPRLRPAFRGWGGAAGTTAQPYEACAAHRDLLGRVGNSAERLVPEHLDQTRFHGVRQIGVPKISYRKQHRYFTRVVDHDRARGVWVGVGKSSDTFPLTNPSKPRTACAGAPLGRRARDYARLSGLAVPAANTQTGS